jgi:hypothetical protein
MNLNIEDRFPTAEQFWQTLSAPSVQPITPMPAVHDPLTPAPVVAIVANSALGSLTTQPQEAPERTRRRVLLPLLLVILALGIVSGLATAFWPFITGHHAQTVTPTAVVQHKVAPTTVPTAKPTPTHARAGLSPLPTATPISTTAPTSPPAPSLYPNVAGTHYGNVHNTTGNINAGLTVSLYQNQSNLSGNVTIGSQLQGSGPITSGSVQQNNSIQFTVQGYNGHAPLWFYGTVQSNGSMGGQYCSIDQTGHCNANSGGQGTWGVGAIASSAGS